MKKINKIETETFSRQILFSAQRFTAVILLFVICFFSACLPGGFSRGQAAEMISKNQQYTTVSFMNIDVGMLPYGQARAWQITPDYNAEQAVIEAKKYFLKRQPQLWAAEHLGYINLFFENPELKFNDSDLPYDLYTKKLGTWHFKARAEITDKGKKMWRDAGFPENERALLTGIRDYPKITGLVDEDKITKKVEFSYKWKPTELGAALDQNNPAFSTLPEELQNVLKNPKSDIFINNNKMLDFNSERKGVSYFKKYDDGWRIMNLTLL